MGMKLRLALLLCALAAALYTGGEALETLKPELKNLPEEIYRDFAMHESSAPYYLRAREGYVAVYAGKKAKQPQHVTEIELKSLREADRAMLEAGLPVKDRTSLLMLLEDFGS